MKHSAEVFGRLLSALLALAVGWENFSPMGSGVAQARGVVLARGDEGKAIKALRKIQKRIEREQRAVGEVDRERASVVDALRALEQVLADEEQELSRAEADVQASTRQLARLERQKDQVGTDLANLERRLARRLSALYKLGEVGYFRILFSSKDYQDLARRTRFLKRIIASDGDLIGEYRERLRVVGRQAEELDASRRKLSELERAALRRRGAVEGWRREKVALLDQLAREKEARLAAIADLERAAEALQGTFDELREVQPLPGPDPAAEGVQVRAVPRESFRQLRGRIPMPVDGKIIKRFGLRTDPEVGTRIRSNGITVRALYGEGIRAVFGGRVLYSGWFRGYGRILIMDHGGGYYTLVAHASELLKEVGDEVASGEVVARVGESGSLEGPVVYFEIRERGRPVDPLSWLRH